MPLRIGILTVSDRASAGVYEDLGGPAVARVLAEHLRSPWEAETRIVPDELPAIAAALRCLVDARGCRAVFTTGGTGPAPRDVTPEATAAVCDRMLPGFGELMRQVSMRSTPTAIMSRQTAGTRGPAVIVNLPGPRARSPTASRWCSQRSAAAYTCSAARPRNCCSAPRTLLTVRSKGSPVRHLAGEWARAVYGRPATARSRSSASSGRQISRSGT